MQITSMGYYRMMVEKFGPDVEVKVSAQTMIEVNQVLAELRIEIERLKSHDECTCTPLDGGLGAQPCTACKRTAGKSEIEF